MRLLMEPVITDRAPRRAKPILGYVGARKFTCTLSFKHPRRGKNLLLLRLSFEQIEWPVKVSSIVLPSARLLSTLTVELGRAASIFLF